MKKLLTVLLLLTVVTLALASCGRRDDDNVLVLYTSAGASEFELIVDLFTAAHPDITVEIVSGGTGELASRITAERANPQGDVLMGGGATTFIGIADMMYPFESRYVNLLIQDFVPDDNLFTPVYVNLNSIIVNRGMTEAMGISVQGWECLLDERLRGNISFASPAESSSALETIINIMSAMSPTDDFLDGWDFTEQFLRNLDGRLASSSSAAYLNVVQGEFAVGIANEDKTITYMQAGADVYAVYAQEGLVLRSSNIGIIRGARNLENAKLFIDFVVSFENQTAMESGLHVRPARLDVPMTTVGRLSTDELHVLPYPPGVVAADIRRDFQDMWTGF